MENKNHFLNKLISYTFRIIFVLLIIINYIYFVVYTWLPLTTKNEYIPYTILTFFHLLLIMVLWTLIKITISEPGQVPIYWGFYFGDSDSKRRRYCLMCNVFKPDRCHHCSICNKCVLNMDHHCPWINNCIGFFNRKFFIQMLFYLTLTIIYILAANGKFTYDIVSKILKNRVNLKSELTGNLGYIFLYTLDVVLLLIIGLFFKFHLLLIIENKTTIETIDKKGIKFMSLVIYIL
jgi:palmitoyltransferase ZDHHC2/15/20